MDTQQVITLIRTYLANNPSGTTLNGTGFVKATGTVISYDNSTYITGNQTITLSGDVSGSGSTAITTAIGAGKVTNAMLAGSIAYSKLSLTGAILNADLAGSIAYSKLSLTGAILNADLAGSIAYSKLSLTGAVLNADLAGSIADGKLASSYIYADGTRALTGNWAAGAFSATHNSVIIGSAANTISGGAASGGNLTLFSTTHATKGKILFGNSMYDEVNNWLGMSITPTSKFHLSDTFTGTGAYFSVNNILTVTPPSNISTTQEGMSNVVNVTGTNQAASIRGLVGSILISNTHVSTGSSYMAGILSDCRTSGTAQPLELTAYDCILLHASSGTIANMYGLKIRDIFTNSGTITNTYGVYIGDVTLGTQTNKAYGLYQLNTDARNYFGSPVGIGQTNPTALLHLKAGTATASTAPLKFTSGTNLTTGEAGAMEYDGTNLFFTRAGTTRESVICSNAVNSVSPTAPNRTITVVIAGTTYYLSAKTTND